MMILQDSLVKTKNNIENENKDKLNLKTSKRNICIDLLRIIASFFVIVCHTNHWGFKCEVVDLSWILSVGVYFISKTAVPIFFIISGALHLNKDYSHSNMLKKVCTRILIPLFLCSGLIYFKDNFEISINNFIGFLKAICNANILLHYWFLYALAGLYIATPFIRKMIMKFDDRDYLYFFCWWIIFFGILPIIKKYANIAITDNFNIPVLSGYLGYYVFGHYIFNYKEINKKHLKINIFSLFVVTLALVLLTYLEFKRTNIFLYNLDKLNYISIIILTFNIVYIMKYICLNINFKEKSERIILKISSTTFGIYLFHGVFLGKYRIIYYFINLCFPSFFAIIIIQIIIYISMLFMVYCIRKIPIVKKII